jgi:hypothetical protein
VRGVKSQLLIGLKSQGRTKLAQRIHLLRSKHSLVVDIGTIRPVIRSIREIVVGIIRRREDRLVCHGPRSLQGEVMGAGYDSLLGVG